MWIEPPAAVAPEQLSVEPDTPHRSVAPARPLLPRPHRHHPLNDVPIEHTDTLNVLARHQLLPVATLAALQERHSRALHELEQVGSAPVVLHGDAHRGNLLRDDRGWFWVDLEETCLGPPEWDLAALDDPDAVAAYAARVGRTGPSAAELAPFRRARDLEAAVWLAAMAHLYPARYRAAADRQLAQVLGRGSA